MLDYQKTQESLMIHTDEQLLQQMADDDRRSFTLLYQRYWENLFITAAKALRGKDAAADVVQDVFLSLWNRRNELNIQDSLAAYLHTCVRYKCIHYIEKNITRRDYLVQLAEVMVNSSSANAAINLDVKEMQETINKTVAEMPAKMREVYKLSREQHLSHKEIAGYMNISVETVKKHIHHALHLIRRDLLPHTFFILLILVLFCLC
ncbi:MAG: RNA polymerase sigma-70 factor [Ginsengibacter sp.]